MDLPPLSETKDKKDKQWTHNLEMFAIVNRTADIVVTAIYRKSGEHTPYATDEFIDDIIQDVCKDKNYDNETLCVIKTRVKEILNTMSTLQRSMMGK